MQKHSVDDLINFDEESFCSRVLFKELGYRTEFLSMRERQWTPEQVMGRGGTIYPLIGQITIHEGFTSCDPQVGEVVCIPPGSPYRIEAQTDSALLIQAELKEELST